MRASNKFSLDKTLGTLFGNRDKDIMTYVRKSIKIRHHDLQLDKHLPHMQDADKMLRPRVSYNDRIKNLADCHFEDHEVTIQESIIPKSEIEKS